MMRAALAALLLSPALGLSLGAARPRCSVRMKAKVPKAAAAAVANDPAVVAAAAALLEEAAKEERNLGSIERQIATLEASELPPKPRKALVADWELAYASDAAAVAPFVSGEGNGPFQFVESVFFRLRPSDRFSSIEVLRRVGPFGNSKTSLCGAWSMPKGAAATLRWKASYTIDARGREVEPPSSATAAHEAQVTHISPTLLILRRAADAASFVVLSRVDSIDKSLEALAVDPETPAAA